MTDCHTDVLAMTALETADVSATVFTNLVSRLVVDPERFVGETEPMEAVGMGAVYRVTSNLRPLREPDPSEQERLLNQWFHPYASAFADLVDAKLDVHGRVVIVDLHSFPKLRLPYEPDLGAERPGICIGTDQFHTPDGLRTSAFSAFAPVRYGVTENSPFAGTYVPLKHWGQNHSVSSIMIEVRRDLYQIEPGGPLHYGYEAVVRNLATLFLAILNDVDF
jgi:N-formylglutamate amidohydrolase